MSKPKAVNFRLIGQVEHPEPHRLLAEYVRNHHQHLKDARIALAWRFGWSENKDGLLTLGQCRKASDLSRELVDYDFVILLNYDAWDTFTDKQRAALIDHELCHAAVTLDANGEAKEDDRGRKVYRIRKHDVEEFREVITRHGLYKADLEAFFATFIDRPTLFDGDRPEIIPTPKPLADDDSWKSTSLGGIGIANGCLKSLYAADLHTIGDLADFSTRSNLTDLPGIGEANADAIQNALERFWAARKAENGRKVGTANIGSLLGQISRPLQASVLSEENGRKLVELLEEPKFVFVKDVQPDADETFVIVLKGVSKAFVTQALQAAAEYQGEALVEAEAS